MIHNYTKNYYEGYSDASEGLHMQRPNNPAYFAGWHDGWQQRMYREAGIALPDGVDPVMTEEEATLDFQVSCLEDAP